MRKSAGRQRLALALFGVLLIVLFAIVAVADGLSQPSVPEGDVVLVQDVPADVGEVSEEEFRVALVQQAAGEGIKKLPKDGSSKLKELKEKTLSEILNSIWIQGEAEEMGIKPPTARKLEIELDKIKEANFPTPAAYKEFLESSKFTQEDVDERVELQVISAVISQRVRDSAGVPTKAEIADYYESERDTLFTTKPSRDVRIITNKDKAEVEAAKAALEADDSAANWKKVAEKYSSDPATAAKGGLQPALTEELLATAGPLKEAIFDAATNELVGPVKFQGNYTLVSVVKLNAEKVQELEEVEEQISGTLQQQQQESALNEFIAGWQSKWESRTFCAADFAIESCGNYKGDGRPAGADPACYEANPKKPPAACPAPVTSISPAVPGSVSKLQPQGERKPLGPVPAGGWPEGLPEGLPEGVEALPGE